MLQSTVKECILIFAPKSSDLHPIPSKLLIECIGFILFFLTDLFCSSFASDIFPHCFIISCRTNYHKKCLVYNYLNNCRHVSNFLFITNVLKKLVLSLLSSYLNRHNYYNIFSHHIVLATALKQLFCNLLMICSFLLTTATYLLLLCLALLQHLTQFITHLSVSLF